MDYVFNIENGFIVPDGTMVYPFLNPRDSESRIPWELSADVSLAVGEIAPRSRSKIHVHPLVTLITWVVAGTLQIKMKEPGKSTPYIVTLQEQQAALTNPQTYLQHINQTDVLCRVLYFVSPAYVFLMEAGGTVVYDDAVVVDHDWATLAKRQWLIPALENLSQVRETRSHALMLLAQRKQKR